MTAPPEHPAPEVHYQVPKITQALLGALVDNYSGLPLGVGQQLVRRYMRKHVHDEILKLTEENAAGDPVPPQAPHIVVLQDTLTASDFARQRRP